MHGTNPVYKPRQTNGLVMDVHEVFETVQGEGPYAGVPALFIRLSHCNLRCWFCFGWRDNAGRHPVVLMSNGKPKKLGDVAVGDVILTLDDNLDIVETVVTNTMQREVDEWLRITIQGRTYWVTPEHPFFTKRGLVCAKELLVGDIVLDVKPNAVRAFKQAGSRNSIHKPGAMEKKVANTDYRVVGSKLSRTIAKKKADGIYKHPTDQFSAEQRAEWKRRIAITKVGETNPNWQGGFSANCRTLKDEVRQGLHPCKICDAKKRLQVHHRNGNRRDDRWNNLVVLCQSCHSKVHRFGRNWWKSPRSDGKVTLRCPPPPELIVAKDRNGKLVQKIVRVNRNDAKWFESIRPKPLEVHNISCAPYNTYLADSMWVHNCDTEFDKVKPTSVWELLLTAKQWRSRVPNAMLVVITGGEPLAQNLHVLVNEFVQAGFHIQLETAGSLPPIFDTFYTVGRVVWPMRPGVSIVCSPKTPNINTTLQPYITAYKYIIGSDDEVDDDGIPIVNTQDKDGKRKPLFKPSRTVNAEFDAILDAQIYIQPRDDGDPSRNEENLRRALMVVTSYGYVLSLQLHKSLRLP